MHSVTSVVASAGAAGDEGPSTVTPYAYLLDDYPTNIYGAWSLRKLSSTYTGSCITVRRVSDTTDQDFGFVDNYIDTESIYTFLSGSGNYGFLKEWYDQSGNSRDMDLPTAEANMLVVADSEAAFYKSGSLLYINEGGKRYSQTQRHNDIHTYHGLTTFVTSYAHATNQDYVTITEHTSGKFSIGAINDQVYFRTGSNIPYGGMGYVSGSATQTQDAMNTITANLNVEGEESSLYFEGSQVATATQGLRIRMGNMAFPDQGKSPDNANPVELVMYRVSGSLPISAIDRAAIETNINDYYKTY